MLAARLYSPGDIRLEEVPDPSPPEGWALVRSRAVGICGTDKAFYRGTYPLFKSPIILGHEVSGEVVEGPEDLIGARVVSEINFACLRCMVCREGMYIHCPYRKTLGIDYDGGMAELFIAPAWALHRHEMPHTRAFAVEPLAAVLNAFRQAPPRPGSLVAVLGTGLMGLLSAQVAGLLGGDVVLVARPGSRKAGIARSLGLRVYTMEEAMEYGRAEGLGGLGFDIVVEATGTNEGLKAAVALARPRGVVYLKSTPGGEASLPQTIAVVKELRLVGTRCGSSREFKHAIRLLQEERIAIPEPRTYPLSRVREAFEEAMKPDSVRVVVEP